MRIALKREVSADKLNDDTSNVDVIFCGFNGEIIDFRKELKGDSEKLLAIGRLSRDKKSVVIGGYVTENYGLTRLSAVVADKGRILGISDMSVSVHNTVYSLGSGFKVYNITGAKIGVLIGDDILFPESIRSLTDCDADVIFVINGSCKQGIFLSVLRSQAYLYGVPLISIGSKITAVDGDGNIIIDSQSLSEVIDVDTKKRFSEVYLKRRGFKKNEGK